MKKKLNITLLLLPIFLLLGTVCFGQQEFDTPKNIPPFNMLLSDGTTYYNASHVEKGKPLMIIYFDPECQHCQHFTKQIIKNITKFNAVQIVMICDAPGIPPLKKFVDMFNLTKYANIKAGTEGMYHATMSFYHVDVTPFTALYDKNGALITSYRTIPEIQTVISQLSK